MEEDFDNRPMSVRPSSQTCWSEVWSSLCSTLSLVFESRVLNGGGLETRLVTVRGPLREEQRRAGDASHEGKRWQIVCEQRVKDRDTQQQIIDQIKEEPFY